MAEDYVRNYDVAQQVHDWVLYESLYPYEAIDCDCDIDAVRHAFVLAFHFLRNYEYGFEKILELTLCKGGDTNTNASIVCAMMGALYGEPHIPLGLKNPVLQFRPDRLMPGSLGYTRPLEYSAYNIWNTVNNVLGMDSTFDNSFRNTKTYYQDHMLF
jgi:hypothetical protein